MYFRFLDSVSNPCTQLSQVILCKFSLPDLPCIANRVTHNFPCLFLLLSLFLRTFKIFSPRKKYSDSLVNSALIYSVILVLQTESHLGFYFCSTQSTSLNISDYSIFSQIKYSTTVVSSTQSFSKIFQVFSPHKKYITQPVWCVVYQNIKSV
jgi:hypothetical protein